MGTKWTRRGGFAVFMVAIAGGAAVAGGVAGAGGAALGQGAGSTVRVAAAADLEPLLPAVLAAFEQRTGVHAEASYGSSATLAQQIVNGAPFDVFMAADMSFPQKVVDAGLAEQAKPVPYARGTPGAVGAQGCADPAWRPADVRHPAEPGARVGRDREPGTCAVWAGLRRRRLRRWGSMGRSARSCGWRRISRRRRSTPIRAMRRWGSVSLTSASTARLTTDGTYVAVPATAYPSDCAGCGDAEAWAGRRPMATG